MAFTNSLFIIGILPWFLIAFNRLKSNQNTKRLLIILANILFYIWGGFFCFIFTVLMCVFTYFFCRILNKYKKKSLLIIFCIAILLPLVLIKGSNFFITNINMLFNMNFFSPNFLIPMGLSFYTFESISYMVDVYRNEKIDISLINTISYLLFFPTITSGPILRISTFNSELYDNNKVEINNNLERIIKGLCKKVLIANNIAIIADYYFDGVFAGNTYSILGLWFGSISYTLQLYFDFSGYSDIAIGIAGLMGFKIPENFNKPYSAKSISDFWRRWHITLSLWFRDYIYIPLGGNKCTKVNHIRNLFIVWLLTGMWHGMDLSFIVWGMGYFILLVIEKYNNVMRRIGEKWYGHIYTMFFVNLLWVPFRAANIETAINYIKGMFGLVKNGSTILEYKALHFIPFFAFTIILLVLWDKICYFFEKTKILKIIRGVILILLLMFVVCAIINMSYTPYIYGNF